MLVVQILPMLSEQKVGSVFMQDAPGKRHAFEACINLESNGPRYSPKLQ